MITVDGFVVEPLTPDRLGDFERVLGRGGISGCWCMYWTVPTTALWRAGATGGNNAANRGKFRAIVAAGPPPGLISYVDGEPAGWCRLMQRRDLPGLANSQYFRTDLDIDNVWSLPCFVVRKQHRGRGMTGVLIKAAVEYLSAHGGGVLEAYPWDTSERKAPSTVYTGLASTFERLGFDVVQRLAPHKPMMRLLVEGAEPGSSLSAPIRRIHMATTREGNKAALLVVDVQVGVVADAWEATRVISNIARSVERARAAGVPVLWVQHSDDELPHGSSEWQLVPELSPAPGESIVHKHFNSSFEETSLETELEMLGATRIILAGTATNWCVRATAYGALDRGYDLTLLADAHTTEDLVFADGRTINAADIVDELNTVMGWINYPGRTSTTVTSEDIDFFSA